MPYPRKYPANLYRRVNGEEWILAECTVCHTDNYCEQHGTAAECHKCKRETEHVNVPYDRRNHFSSMIVMHRAKRLS
jgi:hypothetical protein